MSPPSEDWAKSNERMNQLFFHNVTKRYGRTDITKASCAQVAGSILKTQDFRPVDISGLNCWSLVSITRGKVVQFRLEPLDDEVLALAQDIYGGLTPLMVRHKAFQRNSPEPQDIIKDAQHHLHLLETLPCVVTHNDLGVLNLFADPQTGAITSVIDWDEATIEPFGMSIIGVYESWLYWPNDDDTDTICHDHVDVLERVFWDRLWSALSPILMRDVHGPAVRTAAVIGAAARLLGTDTLDLVGDAPDIEHILRRPKGYMPGIPRIQDGTRWPIAKAGQRKRDFEEKLVAGGNGSSEWRKVEKPVVEE
ncbi:hypothetical protein ANO11243_070570 [Dothideomycetidae sp. 11243]|nr:hypothetical protein ANO11243_070570 [fungal sp. No.11243]